MEDESCSGKMANRSKAAREGSKETIVAPCKQERIFLATPPKHCWNQA